MIRINSAAHMIVRWPRSRPGPSRFLLHFVEMVLAMMVGMALLIPLRILVPDLDRRPDAEVMLMAVSMVVGMGLWMRVRAHGWRMIAEMSAVMVAPFALLLLPHYAGWLAGDMLSGLGHTLMFAAMLGLMLLRRHHYSQPQGWAWPWHRPSQGTP